MPSCLRVHAEACKPAIGYEKICQDVGVVNSYLEQRKGRVDIREVNYKQEKIFGKRAKHCHIQSLCGRSQEAKCQIEVADSRHATLFRSSDYKFCTKIVIKSGSYFGCPSS